jgi:transposase
MVVAARVSRRAFEEAWLSGKHGDQIAAQFGLNRSTVTRFVKRFGLPLRVERRPARWIIPIDRRGEFRVMWLAGVMNRDMAKHFGCHRRSIANHAAKEGFPPRPASQSKSLITIEQFRELSLAVRLSVFAGIEQEQFRLAEMVDHIRSRVAA